MTSWSTNSASATSSKVVGVDPDIVAALITPQDQRLAALGIDGGSAASRSRVTDAVAVATESVGFPAGDPEAREALVPSDAAVPVP